MRDRIAGGLALGNHISDRIIAIANRALDSDDFGMALYSILMIGVGVLIGIEVRAL